MLGYDLSWNVFSILICPRGLTTFEPRDLTKPVPGRLPNVGTYTDDRNLIKKKPSFMAEKGTYN
jgi:hypothetical protein